MIGDFKELETIINGIEPRLVTHAEIAGGAIRLYLLGKCRLEKDRHFTLLSRWLVEDGDRCLVSSIELGEHEHFFESAQGWSEYKKREDECRAIIATLVGRELLTARIDSAGNLLLELAKGPTINCNANEKDRRLDWHFNDDELQREYLVTADGVELWDRAALLTEIIAERRLLIEKDGETKNAQLQIGKPQAYKNGSFICAYSISTPFGAHLSHSFGVDTLQSLSLALVGAQMDVAKLAALNGAKVYFLGEEQRATLNKNDEYNQIHCLMGKIFDKWSQLEEYTRTPDATETLKQLECLLRRNAKK